MSDSSSTRVQTPGRPVPATPLQPRRRGIIIGASDGLGAALARRLAREGYTLALLARRKDKIDALCHELNTSVRADCAYSYVHDVSRSEDVPALLRRIVADLGGLDLVVYCAGINRPPGGIETAGRPPLSDDNRRVSEASASTRPSRSGPGVLLALCSHPYEPASMLSHLATRVPDSSPADQGQKSPISLQNEDEPRRRIWGFPRTLGHLPHEDRVRRPRSARDGLVRMAEGKTLCTLGFGDPSVRTLNER